MSNAAEPIITAAAQHVASRITSALGIKPPAGHVPDAVDLLISIDGKLDQIGERIGRTTFRIDRTYVFRRTDITAPIADLPQGNQWVIVPNSEFDSYLFNPYYNTASVPGSPAGSSRLEVLSLTGQFMWDVPFGWSRFNIPGGAQIRLGAVDPFEVTIPEQWNLTHRYTNRSPL